MNRIERRIAGTNGSRPGAPVCNPGKPAQQVTGMLGGNSALYQTPQQRVASSNTRQINGLRLLQNQGDRISRLEQKLEQLENQYALSTTKMDFKVSNAASKIDLINGEYREQMRVMREYIKELESKLKDSNDIPVVTAVKKEISSIESTNQENVTLEIVDN